MPDDIIDEIWKPCFDGIYAVSNLGRIRRERAAMGARKGYLLRLSLRNGYTYFNPVCNGIQTIAYVHHVVASAFLGVRPTGHEINHKNGIKTDNLSTNLEYISASENCKHAFRLGLSRPPGGNNHIPARGERCGSARLTEKQVRELRRRHKNGEGLRPLAREFGVVHATVRLAVSGSTWSHVA